MAFRDCNYPGINIRSSDATRRAPLDPVGIAMNLDVCAVRRAIRIEQREKLTDQVTFTLDLTGISGPRAG